MFKLNKIAAAVAAATAGAAFATPPDFSAITGAVDWSTVGIAILAISALKAVPLVVKAGAGMVLRMIGR